MFKSDLEIAQEAQILPIEVVAKKAGISYDELEMYGKYKAKVTTEVGPQKGKLILVTAINPTPAGEGKSTTTVGLVDGLAKINKNVMGCLREPSLGPVFGIKGGAAGGGHAQVIPMEDINLHFTGDMHAITTANNLVAAIIDNHIHQGNELGIDLDQIKWKRCLDMNDRALREVTVGQGPTFNGVERKDGFNITVASEIMAVLCLSNDMEDFKNKVARCIVAYDITGKPVTIKDLGIVGAIAMIMKDALKPNLVQTLEHNPILMHGGPFANIAHGCNSLIATKLALTLSDYVVTEAGFGADLGSEKFIDLKCRFGGLKPSAIVIVATIRALKMHGGVEKELLTTPNVEALELGLCNLKKHIETVQEYKLPFVVAINKFATDSNEEVDHLNAWCERHNFPVSHLDSWAKGSEGAVDLATKVVAACDKDAKFDFLYDEKASFERKVFNVVTKAYGATGFDLTERAQKELAQIRALGYDHLPICMAKTQSSLSDDPKRLGRPTDFRITISELRLNSGAGFIVALTGKVMTMPGLGKKPAALNMDVDQDGKIKGLF